MIPLLADPAEFAALVQRFFAERLLQQQAVSPRTVAAYRDRYGITTRTPLGPAPDSDAQKIDAARAKAALARLRDLASAERHDEPSRTARREGAGLGL